MEDQIDRIRGTLKHIGLRTIVLTLVIFFIVAGIASFIGIRFYDTKKEVLQKQGEVNTKRAAMEYNNCLLTRVNIVTVASYAVDKMLSSGADNYTIEKYLTEQTDYIVATLDPSTTGLYGWINGVYIDGAGWVPDEDYVATERPWYTQTLESDQKIVFVEPYLDAQTNSIMMTVSDLLSDGQSVVAMDVSLEPIQQIVERVASAVEGSQALVIDVSGTVVAHSDMDQLGKNYLDTPNSLGEAITRRILTDGQMIFDIETDEGNYSVYADELQGGWYSVSLINADIWYRPLRNIIILSGVILATIAVIIVFVFMRLNARNQTLQQLLDRIDQEEKQGKEWKMLSETDRMTGLYDRVSGKRMVEELLSYEFGGIFLMIDVDKFKSINDVFGHQVGDQVIIAIADAMRSTFRSNDILMRLGGDEFGVFAIGIT